MLACNKYQFLVLLCLTASLVACERRIPPHMYQKLLDNTSYPGNHDPGMLDDSPNAKPDLRTVSMVTQYFNVDIPANLANSDLKIDGNMLLLEGHDVDILFTTPMGLPHGIYWHQFLSVEPEYPKVVQDRVSELKMQWQSAPFDFYSHVFAGDPLTRSDFSELDYNAQVEELSRLWLRRQIWNHGDEIRITRFGDDGAALIREGEYYGKEGYKSVTVDIISVEPAHLVHVQVAGTCTRESLIEIAELIETSYQPIATGMITDGWKSEYIDLEQP